MYATIKTLIAGVASAALAAVGAYAATDTAPADSSQEVLAMQQRRGGPGNLGGPGGDQNGQVGRMLQRRGGGGNMILRMPEVQQHLKLTQQQIQAIQEMRPERGGQAGGRRGGQGGPPTGGQGGAQGPSGLGGPNGLPSGDPADGPLGKILNDSQMKRFKELSLQWQGPSAVTAPHMREKFGVTESQLQQIQQIMMDNRPQINRGERPTGEQMAAHKKKVNGLIFNTFSNDQKAKWKAATGQPFNFPTPEMGGRGGQRGGQGGQRGGGGRPGGRTGGGGGTAVA